MYGVFYDAVYDDAVLCDAHWQRLLNDGVDDDDDDDDVEDDEDVE